MLRRTKKPNAQVSDRLLGMATCGTVQPQRHPWFPASPSSFVARARCLYTPPGSIISCVAPRWRSAPFLSLPHRSHPWFTCFFMRPAGAAPDGPCRRGHLQGWQATCAAPSRAGARFKAHRSQVQVSARDETLLWTRMLVAAAAEAGVAVLAPGWVCRVGGCAMWLRGSCADTGRLTSSFATHIPPQRLCACLLVMLPCA